LIAISIRAFRSRISAERKFVTGESYYLPESRCILNVPMKYSFLFKNNNSHNEIIIRALPTAKFY